MATSPAKKPNTFNPPNASTVSTWVLSSPVRRRSAPEKTLIAAIRNYKALPNNANLNIVKKYRKGILDLINVWGGGNPRANLEGKPPPKISQIPGNPKQFTVPNEIRLPPIPVVSTPAGAVRRSNQAPNTGNWPNGTYRVVNMGGNLGNKSVYKFGNAYYYTIQNAKTPNNLKNNKTFVWKKTVNKNGKFIPNATSANYMKVRGMDGKVSFVNRSTYKANLQKLVNNLVRRSKINNGMGGSKDPNAKQLQNFIENLAKNGGTENWQKLSKYTRDNNNRAASPGAVKNFWNAVNAFHKAASGANAAGNEQTGLGIFGREWENNPKA